MTTSKTVKYIGLIIGNSITLSHHIQNIEYKYFSTNTISFTEHSPQQLEILTTTVEPGLRKTPEELTIVMEHNITNIPELTFTKNSVFNADKINISVDAKQPHYYSSSSTRKQPH